MQFDGGAAANVTVTIPESIVRGENGMLWTFVHYLLMSGSRIPCLYILYYVCLLLVLHIVYYIGGSLVVVAFFNRLANFLPRVYANKR